MRAYMSSSYGRMSHLCAFVPPQLFPCAENDLAIGAATADKAVAEARAILAETEPETLDTSHVPASSLRWYDVTPRETSYRLMLAEALAAFVGEGN